MNIIHDFETRSACDLRKCGAHVYSEHPSTEVMCYAVKREAEPPKIWLPPKFVLMLPRDHDLPLMSLYELIKNLNEAKELEAHNAEFERAIWANTCTKKYAWPEPPVEKFRCSLAKCSMHALPRGLAQAGAALKLKIQKDDYGHRLMLKMCKPRKPNKAEKAELIKRGCEVEATGRVIPPYGAEPYYLWHEKPEDLVRLAQYCLRDVDAEYAVSGALEDLPPAELKLWQLDQEINFRGIRVDQVAAQAFIDAIAAYEEKLLAEVRILTRGAVSTPRKVAVLRSWLESQGVVAETLQKSTVAEILAQNDLSPEIRRVLEIRQQLGRASTAKYKAAILNSSADGRARGMQLYHGAGTGRFSGRKIQLQNLPRGTFKDVEFCINATVEGGFDDYFSMMYGDIMGAAASCIRGTFIASPGHRLVSADYAAIEARVNAWLAGQQDIVQAFYDNKKLYELAASGIFGVPYESVDKVQRQVGKVSELALGFQGGIGAYVSMARNYPDVDLEALPDFVFPSAPDDILERAWLNAKTYLSRTTDCAVSLEAAAACDVIKQLWRQKRPMIVQLWYKLEEACLEAVKTPGKVFGYRSVRYKVDGNFLKCKLPSGRCLFYYSPGLQIKKTPWGKEKEVVTFWGVDSTTKKFVKQHLYGGLQCENCVQATARDIMVEGVFNVEDAGYPVVLTVHDELVSDVKNGHGSLKEYEELMATVPSWAKGLPLKAEGWEGKRYRK